VAPAPRRDSPVRRASTFLVGTVAAIVLAVLLARAAFPLPDASVRTPSDALPADPATRLGRLMGEAAVAHPGLSGVRALSDGHDALASRLTLIDEAQASIDVQYYIWNEDVSGLLLLGALQRAAERGVRVRVARQSGWNARDNQGGTVGVAARRA